MKRAVLPLLSLVTISSLGYLFQKKFMNSSNVIERTDLIQIIISLRKKIFSTLREIAYVANCLKLEESGIQPKKIKEIMMRDGASAQIKLDAIQQNVLAHHNVTRQIFQRSCNHYSHSDIEIKMLLQNFKSDIQMALDGTIDSYNGPIPHIDGAKTIKLYREIVCRRMKIIQQKFLNNVQNSQCLKMQLQIQEYLERQGIYHKKEASQKIFLALLQYHYKNDSTFMQEFQTLQTEFEDFIQEIKLKKNSGIKTQKATNIAED